MADYDSSASPLFRNIPDDSKFVHQAMRELEFFGEFCDLTIVEMQCVLLMAEHFKRTQGRPEIWES
jgi:hypothetical protein